MEIQENELWKSIVSAIESLPESSSVPRQLYRYLQNVLSREMCIDIDPNNVCINHRALDLSKRRKIHKVFEVFLNHGDQRLSRSSLIEHIYTGPTDDSSFRQQTCRNHNVVKLLSRARKLATRTFSAEHGLGFQWFPYDSATQTWKLYSLREE